jgi:cytochrome c oxidase subunit 2
MKGIIEVVTQEEFDAWIAKQKPNYLVANPDKEPVAPKPASDTTVAKGTAALIQ